MARRLGPLPVANSGPAATSALRTAAWQRKTASARLRARRDSACAVICPETLNCQIGERRTMNDESLFQRALALAESPDLDFLKLGRYLVELRGMSPEQFQNFIKLSRLNRRTVYYFAEIAE